MESEIGLSVDEKCELLKIARESVIAAVSGSIYEPRVPDSPGLFRKAGAFVTLHERGELRGCIGYVEPRLPVCETVAETAAKAAMSDPRFASVIRSELEGIELEISVLSLLKRIVDLDEIVVGKHGLLMERGFFRGLLLPQVATENRWNREQFLEYTCVKAGLEPGSYRDPDTHIFVFTAEVFGEREFGLIPEKNLDKKVL